MPSARDDGQARPNTIAPHNGRRSLLAGAAAALAAAPFATHAAQLQAVGTLARDTDPDADLLAVCAEFMATDAEVQAWNRGERPEYADDAVSDRLMDRWHDLAWQIEGIPARTAAQISAKARVAAAALYSVRTPDGTFDGVEETLALSALRDVAERAA